MRFHHLLAIPLTSVLVLAGCSSGSGLRTSGRTTSTAGGSFAGQNSAGALGGSQTSAGGSGSMSLGGTSGGSTASASSMAGGGAGVVSSSTVAGGSTSAGGAMSTGGRSTGSSFSRVTGGSSASGGGGAGATSVGSSGPGGTTSSGGSSTVRTPDAGVGDGGIVASGYCEGQNPKLTYQGQTVAPAVTDYMSSVVMDCCNGYGVNLHSTAVLGFDVAVELILSLNISIPGDFDLGTTARARSLVRKSSDPITAIGAANSQGRLRIFGADASAGLAEFGLCLEVTDASSTLAGTRIYVPRVSIGFYESNKRFQIFLLKDSTLGAGKAAAQSLDSLELTDSPVLDLGRIAYIEKATTRIGFTPGQKVGNSLRTRLGTPLEMPFVVVADGARIYLGTFTSQISSIGPTGPFVYVEDITADDLTLKAPLRGTDPRNDDRIIKALSERGKLVP